MKKIKSLLIVCFIFSIEYSYSNICSETFDQILEEICVDKYINFTHKCVYSKGICDYSFISCESYMGNDPSICNSIIPSNNNQAYKCEIINQQCTTVLKVCKDFETNENAIQYCNYLTTSDINKNCISTDKGCKEQYKTCELYNINEKSKNKIDCEAMSEIHNKCMFLDNECTTVRKECSEMTDQDSCNKHVINSDKKKCSFINNKCIEVYKSCELYDEEATSKTKSECENIIFPYDKYLYYIDYYSKCVFINNQCLRQKLECEEFKDSYYCIRQELENENKKCAYDSQIGCIEVYKSCESEESNKDKDICENIILNYFNEIDFDHKCIFDNNKCKKISKTCDDYKQGQSESFCIKIFLNSYSKCVFKDNKCLMEYTDCPGDHIRDVNLDESVCTSITPIYNYLKCVKNARNSCVSQKKQCSEYKGTDNHACFKYKAEDNAKKCILDNNICSEKYANCEDYTGKDKNICESMIPYNIDGDKLDYYKCKMGEDGICQMVLMKCSEIRNETKCNDYSLSNYKKCAFINNECIEQYKDCNSYTNSGENIDKSTCESIQLNNKLYKCTFISGTPNKCEERKKECSDMKNENECINFSPNNFYKKCVYKNNECIEQYRSCSGYNYYSNTIDKSTCESIILEDFYYKCVFISGSANECKEVIRNCNEFSTKESCNNFPNYFGKKCDYQNNKCITIYKDCDYYTKSETNIDKSTCESIVIEDYIYKCVFISGNPNKCVQVNKECNEATKEYCLYYRPPDENKICAVKNNKCIEVYNNCEAYSTKESNIDKTTCESIKFVRNSYECVFTPGTPNKCERKKKECKEATTKEDCIYMFWPNSNKNCAYINNKCIEQYKDCDSYTNSGENIDKSTCESIQLYDDRYKCVFISGTPNICVKEEKGCRDITIESYQDYCNRINHPSVEKKCSYSNNSCLELDNDNRINEEINEKPKINETNNGSKEVNNTENKEDNSSGKSIKVKLNLFYVIIVMSLLF